MYGLKLNPRSISFIFFLTFFLPFHVSFNETFDVFFFAPGACRYNAAKQPIPGGRVATKGWTLDNYKTLIQQHAGEHVPIVETTEEREIVPLLRKALGMVDGNEL